MRKRRLSDVMRPICHDAPACHQYTRLRAAASSALFDGRGCFPLFVYIVASAVAASVGSREPSAEMPVRGVPSARKWRLMSVPA